MGGPEMFFQAENQRWVHLRTFPSLLGTQPLLQSCWGPPGELGPARAAGRPHVLPWTRCVGPRKGDSEGPPYLPFSVYVSLRNTLTGMLGHFHMDSLQCNSLIFA